MEEESLTIATLQGGAAIQLIDDELDTIWTNIQDTNTEAAKAREVVFKIKVIPDKRREMADIQLSVVSKLAPTKAVEARVAMGTERGRAVATEWRSPQTDLDDFVEPNISPIRNAREG